MHRGMTINNKLSHPILLEIEIRHREDSNKEKIAYYCLQRKNLIIFTKELLWLEYSKN